MKIAKYEFAMFGKLGPKTRFNMKQLDSGYSEKNLVKIYEFSKSKSARRYPRNEMFNKILTIIFLTFEKKIHGKFCIF